MEAHLSSAVRVGPQRLLADRPAAVSAAVCAVSAACCGFALLVLVRRLAGALDQPAPVAVLLGAALVIGCLSWFSRWLWRAALVPVKGSSRDVILDVFVGWAPSVSIIGLTLGLSWPLDRFIDWLVWMPLWVADVLWRKSFFAGEPLAAFRDGTRESLETPPESDWAGDFDINDPSALPAGGPGAGSSDEDEIVLQQLTRTRNAAGQESITGSLRADFAAGQRTAHVYVGFCPPFAGLPTVEVEQSDGPPAGINVGQVLPHGARIDIRLHQDATACSRIDLDLFAGY